MMISLVAEVINRPNLHYADSHPELSSRSRDNLGNALTASLNFPAEAPM
jgi:hypothetical protein